MYAAVLFLPTLEWENLSGLLLTYTIISLGGIEMMERTQKHTKNLTEGSPARLILEFAVPMFLGLLFQQFYSMVDTMIVGKF